MIVDLESCALELKALITVQPQRTVAVIFGNSKVRLKEASASFGIDIEFQ
jgi:hypothetical protein